MPHADHPSKGLVVGANLGFSSRAPVASSSCEGPSNPETGKYVGISDLDVSLSPEEPDRDVLPRSQSKEPKSMGEHAESVIIEDASLPRRPESVVVDASPRPMPNVLTPCHGVSMGAHREIRLLIVSGMTDPGPAGPLVLAYVAPLSPDQWGRKRQEPGFQPNPWSFGAEAAPFGDLVVPGSHVQSFNGLP